MRGWMSVVGVVACLGAGSVVACWGSPSPQDIWNMPARSGLTDAHTSITGLGSGVTLHGDGVVVFRPHVAMSLHLETQLGALPAGLDLVEVNGVTYERTDQLGWVQSMVSPPDPTWQNASDIRLLGQSRLPGGMAWHLAADRRGMPMEMWVRVTDGYPLRLVTPSDGGSMVTFLFDSFNTRQLVQAPPLFEVRPPARNLGGAVGDTLALNSARVGVLSMDPNADTDDPSVQPRPGHRFVVVEVAVQNTGTDPLSTYLDWRLTDVAGGTWPQSPPIRSPAFPAGQLGHGETAKGFLSYDVSRAARGLRLSVRMDEDRATFALG